MKRFDECRLKAARAFAQTMIVVDDEAGDNTAHEQGEEENIQATQPGRHDALAEEKSKGSGGERLRHPLDRKLLIQSALDHGIVCAVVEPDDSDSDDDLAKKVAKTAERADMVSLDWEMNDNGDKAMSIINAIIQQDLDKGGRLRLISLYTGVPRRDDILEKIFSSIPGEVRKKCNIEKDEDRIISENGLQIVWFLKDYPDRRIDSSLKPFLVDEAKLAERLLTEFSKMSEGLLTNVALATIATIRDATHHTLRKFTLSKCKSGMDGPYFHHRALLPSPDDARDYAVSVVLSELESAVDRRDVGDEYAGENAIKYRINELISNDENISIKSNNNEGRTILKHTVSDAIIKGWESTDSCKDLPDDAMMNFTNAFEEDYETGKIALMAFASLTGVQSNPESKDIAPRLSLGSIIQSSKTKSYLLCLQAVCDTVRIRKQDRFFFIPLTKSEKNPEHIVPEGRGGFIGLTAVKKAYTKARSLNFQPNSSADMQVVIAEDRGASGYWFTDAEEDEYKWIANLKRQRAMRAAQEVSQQFVRIGFDEFEPLRRGRHKN